MPEPEVELVEYGVRYTTVWKCTPPEPHARYRVLADHWDGRRTRTIYRIELIEGDSK
jgi:hypothetical protein